MPDDTTSTASPFIMIGSDAVVCEGDSCIVPLEDDAADDKGSDA